MSYFFFSNPSLIEIAECDSPDRMTVAIGNEA